MLQPYESDHRLDGAGNPAGGKTISTGLTIEWQNGPLGRGEERVPPNGAFVETVIAAALDRLMFYQRGKYWSKYNEQAIFNLEAALKALNDRTIDREGRGVEGTHQL